MSTIQDKIEILRHAINTRQQVTGLCNGLYREFCPHLLGNSTSSWNVLVWQFGGHSEKGLPAEGAWRCFNLTDLNNLASKDGQWHRGFYKGRGEQHCVKQIDTAIAAEYSAELR